MNKVQVCSLKVKVTHNFKAQLILKYIDDRDRSIALLFIDVIWNNLTYIDFKWKFSERSLMVSILSFMDGFKYYFSQIYTTHIWWLVFRTQVCRKMVKVTHRIQKKFKSATIQTCCFWSVIMSVMNWFWNTFCCTLSLMTFIW